MIYIAASMPREVAEKVIIAAIVDALRQTKFGIAQRNGATEKSFGTLILKKTPYRPSSHAFLELVHSSSKAKILWRDVPVELIDAHLPRRRAHSHSLTKGHANA